MSTFLLLLKYLPAVLQAISAAEAVVGDGNGKTKKELVMSAIHAVAVVGVSVDQKTVAALSALVDKLVSILNDSGVFGKPAVVPAA